MYAGSIPHDRIIDAFQQHVPGCYVRDYRENNGYITICRNYRDIRWQSGQSTAPVERQIPAITLASLPQGNVTAANLHAGFRLVRPGWRVEFRKAMEHLTHVQQKAITRTLGVGEVFPGVV